MAERLLSRISKALFNTGKAGARACRTWLGDRGDGDGWGNGDGWDDDWESPMIVGCCLTRILF